MTDVGRVEMSLWKLEMRNAAGVLVAQGVISANVNTLECVNTTLTAVNTTLDAGYGLYFTLRHLAVSDFT